MSKRESALVVDSLAHGWSAYQATAAGSTCTANVAVGSAHERLHLTQLGWSIRNAGAAAYTATLNVTDSSIGGTVRASWDMIVPVGHLLDTFNLNIMGLKGAALNVDFGAPAASVVQKVSIAGWRDQSND